MMPQSVRLGPFQAPLTIYADFICDFEKPVVSRSGPLAREVLCRKDGGSSEPPEKQLKVRKWHGTAELEPFQYFL